jgi:hypothetical protein
MKNIHELNINNSLTVNDYGIKTAKNFSWKNTGRKILNVI